MHWYGIRELNMRERGSQQNIVDLKVPAEWRRELKGTRRCQGTNCLSAWMKGYVENGMIREEAGLQKKQWWDQLHWVRSPSITMAHQSNISYVVGYFELNKRDLQRPRKRAWQLSQVIQWGGRASLITSLTSFAKWQKNWRGMFELFKELER